MTTGLVMATKDCVWGVWRSDGGLGLAAGCLLSVSRRENQDGDPRNKSRWRYVDYLWLLMVDVGIDRNIVPPQITRTRTRMCMWRAGK